MCVDSDGLIPCGEWTKSRRSSSSSAARARRIMNFPLMDVGDVLI